MRGGSFPGEVSVPHPEAGDVGEFFGLKRNPHEGEKEPPPQLCLPPIRSLLPRDQEHLKKGSRAGRNQCGQLKRWEEGAEGSVSVGGVLTGIAAAPSILCGDPGANLPTST